MQFRSLVRWRGAGGGGGKIGKFNENVEKDVIEKQSYEFWNKY